MHILNLILGRLAKLDHSLPVVLKDSDLLIADKLDVLEDKGWHCIELNNPDREFLTLIEAEDLAQQDRKAIVYISNRSEKDLVFLAEYWDRGNWILVTAANILSELKIDRSSFKKDFLVSLVRFGIDKDRDWWEVLRQKGIAAVSKVLKNDIWELLRDSEYAKKLSEAERRFLFTYFSGTVFDVSLNADSSPEEAATLIAEKILESSYKKTASDEVKDFYEEWKDSKTYEQSILHHASKFSETHKEELLSNTKVFERDSNHPFSLLEKEIFNSKIDDFLNGEEETAISFAQDRFRKRGVRDADKDNGVHWHELAGLQPLLLNPDFTSMNSLESFLSLYSEELWKYDALDREMRNSSLPEPIRDLAMSKISEIKIVVGNHWSNYYDPSNLSPEYTGLISRVLQEEGKKAVIVVDALRFELAQSINLKTSAEVDRKAIVAITPTETTVGMGALFSSGEIEKFLKDNKVLVKDLKTGRTLDSSNNRFDNLRELVRDVEISDLDSSIGDAEKLVLVTRDIDSLGHDQLIEFYREALEKLSAKIDALLKKGYEVHVVSDHGFFLPEDDTKTKQTKNGSYAAGVRYSLMSAQPSGGVYEQINGSYVVYAESGNVFKDYGRKFWHGGVTHQEVIVPHMVFSPHPQETKWRVRILNKDMLKIIQKDRVDIVLSSDKQLFGSAPRVYIQYLDERIEVEKPIEDPVKIALKINAKNDESFKITVRDIDDGSQYDFTACTFKPVRERLF